MGIVGGNVGKERLNTCMKATTEEHTEPSMLEAKVPHRRAADEKAGANEDQVDKRDCSKQRREMEKTSRGH